MRPTLRGPRERAVPLLLRPCEHFLTGPRARKKECREIPFTRRIHGRNMREIACAYLPDIMYAPKTLVVVGQGMVGYKLLECLADNGATDTWQVIAFGEEPRPAYDRVNLSTYFSGRTAEDLSVADPDVLAPPPLQ